MPLRRLGIEDRRPSNQRGPLQNTELSCLEMRIKPISQSPPKMPSHRINIVSVRSLRAGSYGTPQFTLSFQRPPGRCCGAGSMMGMNKIDIGTIKAARCLKGWARAAPSPRAGHDWQGRRFSIRTLSELLGPLRVTSCREARRSICRLSYPMQTLLRSTSSGPDDKAQTIL